MPVDNATTYSVNPVNVSQTSVRSGEQSTFNSAIQSDTANQKIDNTNVNSSGIIVTNNIKNNSVNFGKNIATEILLQESENAGLSENNGEKFNSNYRNDKKNTDAERIDDKQLDKKILNQTELRNSEIKSDYINQLDRRNQIHNEYLNRLNNRSEQNKIEIVHEPAKNLQQSENQPQQISPPIIPRQTPNAQNITPNDNINNAANNTVDNRGGTIKFLNASNHRALVREALGQVAASVENPQTRFSVTIIPPPNPAQKESAKNIANAQQTTFTIFSTTGRIEQINYNKDQNNRQNQNDKNENENEENKKQKNKNKKNNIELSQTTNLQSNTPQKNNLLSTKFDTQTSNNLDARENLYDKESNLQLDDNVANILDGGVINVVSDNISDNISGNTYGNISEVNANNTDNTSNTDNVSDAGFDLSQLPAFIVTIISDPVKFTGKIDLNNFASNGDKVDGDNIDGGEFGNISDNVIDGGVDFDLPDVSWRNRLMLRIAAACKAMPSRYNLFRIKLNLDSAGELFIKIAKNKNGNYSVSFTATNADVAKKLNDGIFSLKESLADGDVKLDDVEIKNGKI
ncbi:MAG: flagellar hook-length control protein FliK [Planctomycetaceae bacterium]|jgi:hypothetical protein|nr:flagellar hook-length control protein FliK [Planctomycetaceae bacterium]